MEYRNLFFSFCLLSIFLNSSNALSQKLADKQATALTNSAYTSLFSVSKEGIMIGQQNATYKGVGWRGKKNKSDMRDLISKDPAVVGWDLGKLETGSKTNIDNIPFDTLALYIKNVYLSGGINTISWHSNNPLDLSLPVKDQTIKKPLLTLFKDPEALKNYEKTLDIVAAFLAKLRTDDGQAIPILFRPFHENNGPWFWWGRNNGPEAYIKLWKHTVDYLRDKKGLHNLIYVYCTDKFISADQYLSRYPVDDYVDVLGFDAYDSKQYHLNGDDLFKQKIKNMSDILSKISTEKNKPFALTETGYKLMPKKDWWTETLYPAIKDSGMSYVLFWVNAGSSGYWGTYKGQISSENFIKFSKQKDVLFQTEVSKQRLYKK